MKKIFFKISATILVLLPSLVIAQPGLPGGQIKRPLMEDWEFWWPRVGLMPSKSYAKEKIRLMLASLHLK